MNISKLKNKEKKLKLTTLGFTLIELLAVIVILAIIALIAIPVIMNIISKANKSAFKDSAYGIIKAGELYYSEKLLNVEGMQEDISFVFPKAEGLELKGSRPASGNMKVSIDGKVALAISNGKYCVRKGFNDTDVTIDENIEECEVSKIPNPIITTTNACLKKGTCANGTKLNIKVNDTENYDFYVIKDENNELTLIMDRNLGGKVAWITQADYTVAGGTNYGQYGNSDKGPLTALKALRERTTSWTNIESYSYELGDDNKSATKYEEINDADEVTDIRARLLTYTEAASLGCVYASNNSCPKYLYTNTSSSNTEEAPIGYWLSTTSSDNVFHVLVIRYIGGVSGTTVHYENIHGVRPVITISKTI